MALGQATIARAQEIQQHYLPQLSAVTAQPKAPSLRGVLGSLPGVHGENDALQEDKKGGFDAVVPASSKKTQ
jgi:hypothetical protein